MPGVAKIESDDPLERRFHGTCAFAKLQLMRVAEGDIEAGYAEARKRGMIDAGDEAFVRECLVLDGALERGEAPEPPIDQARIDRLQACVIKMNMGDSA